MIHYSEKIKKSIPTIFYGKAKNKYALELTPDIDSTAESRKIMLTTIILKGII